MAQLSDLITRVELEKERNFSLSYDCRVRNATFSGIAF
jgi:hypothetical protein